MFIGRKRLGEGDVFVVEFGADELSVVSECDACDGAGAGEWVEDGVAGL